MNYFANIIGVERIKKEYRKLAFKNHPDKGGDVETMKIINEQYLEALKKCNGEIIRNNDTGKDYTYKYKEDIEKDIMQKIYDTLAEIDTDKCKIMLIGTWLWIDGQTKPFKEKLKKLKYLWHPKRGLWYYRKETRKHYGKSGGSLASIAYRYGYREFDKDNAGGDVVTT